LALPQALVLGTCSGLIFVNVKGVFHQSVNVRGPQSVSESFIVVFLQGLTKHNRQNAIADTVFSRFEQNRLEFVLELFHPIGCVTGQSVDILRDQRILLVNNCELFKPIKKVIWNLAKQFTIVNKENPLVAKNIYALAGNAANRVEKFENEFEAILLKPTEHCICDGILPIVFRQTLKKNDNETFTDTLRTSYINTLMKNTFYIHKYESGASAKYQSLWKCQGSA
jgi:hypothetical protein